MLADPLSMEVWKEKHKLAFVLVKTLVDNLYKEQDGMPNFACAFNIYFLQCSYVSSHFYLSL